MMSPLSTRACSGGGERGPCVLSRGVLGGVKTTRLLPVPRSYTEAEAQAVGSVPAKE